MNCHGRDIANMAHTEARFRAGTNAMSRLTRDPRLPCWFSKEFVMLQSHVIVIDGTFVGAAVRLDTGYRFIATDFRLEDLDGTLWPTLEDVRLRANRLFRTGRIAAPVPAAGPVSNAAL